MAPVGESLHPQEGARFLLERVAIEPGGEGARYRAAVYTPDAVYGYQAVLRLGGEAELSRAGADPAPPELEARLLAHARTAARAAEHKRAEGLPPWPHRILRWRAPLPPRRNR
jgi:hypothetical protein